MSDAPTVSSHAGARFPAVAPVLFEAARGLVPRIREQARAIWGNAGHGSGRDGMHEHDDRYASRFGRRDRTQEDEVADDHVSRLPTQFRRDSFGPDRCPERGLGFALNGPERELLLRRLSCDERSCSPVAASGARQVPP